MTACCVSSPMNTCTLEYLASLKTITTFLTLINVWVKVWAELLCVCGFFSIPILINVGDLATLTLDLVTLDWGCRTLHLSSVEWVSSKNQFKCVHLSTFIWNVHSEHANRLNILYITHKRQRFPNYAFTSFTVSYISIHPLELFSIYILYMEHYILELRRIWYWDYCQIFSLLMKNWNSLAHFVSSWGYSCEFIALCYLLDE